MPVLLQAQKKDFSLCFGTIIGWIFLAWHWLVIYCSLIDKILCTGIYSKLTGTLYLIESLRDIFWNTKLTKSLYYGISNMKCDERKWIDIILFATNSNSCNIFLCALWHGGKLLKLVLSLTQLGSLTLKLKGLWAHHEIH